MKKKKKKKLQPKRFYLSFELYSTPTGRSRVSSTFVPTTQDSLPDIDDTVDEREYGIKIGDEETYAEYLKVYKAAHEFAKFLIKEGEIE